MEYTILESNTLGGLIDKVNVYISLGWKPIGGVGNIGPLRVFQAMVREK